ncbi:hypothetical protein ESY86_15550 [Subsaximicrobium wynnwilliamsii]|uniref:Uncharacterized protein n=1 Tax=Subsaximicrobium wynnwilliamsii TaxID=291179 RepID=A0A5C6ZE46_9FLAO|nr:hypothetical protein [Subsaximicrobium wynnwilliamsii]TXD82240.1 hypothetical protein ESY87_15140 [Subsaximicrobium wynnwilliamsii]TXD87880.1 hypothetical protein ESY86_15550 [Subsaximicrobium wynnwilliamsii]TXE01830.1 hypothetical protein ESY88_14715 [Subsaximicrobium wynnwilliamsii]
MTKKIFFIILLTIVSCKNSRDSESEFMNCVYSKNSESKLTIENTIFEHEVYLKSKGLINGNNGKDYKRLIKDIADEKIAINIIGETLALDVQNLDIDVIGCGEKYSSKDFKAEKLRELFSNMLYKKTDLVKTLNKFNSIVDEEDFKHPFYKICTFVIIDYFILRLNE